MNSLKAEFNIRDVFLTMDCRKHGSGYFTKNITMEANAMKLMSNSIHNLYKMLGGNSTLEDWDRSFDSVSSFRNRGYVAMLQKHLAASGTCLITAGGGAFQSTTAHLYHQYHPNQTQCVYAVY